VAKSAKPKTSAFTKVVAVILIGGLIYVFSVVKDAPPPTKQNTTVIAEVKTPPPPTKDDLVKKQFSTWDGSHYQLEKMIKNSMNDPDSYEHIATAYKIENETVTVFTDFRGNNAFGGKIKNSVAAQFTLDGQFIKMMN
jgi:hypothetical protein